MRIAPPDKTSFRDVKAEILLRITDGRWGPGTLLPGEVDLAQEFQVARATVNRAMRELTEEGILERRRRAGTRVRRSPLRAARFAIPVVRAEIEAAGSVYGYRLLGRRQQAAPAWLRARLGLGGDAEGGALVLHLGCLHLADGRPYQHEDRWINLAALPQAAAADFAAEVPTEWLVAAVPFSEVEISFTAAAAGGEAAAALGMTAGEPVFVAERTTWWQGQPITHARMAFARGYRMTTRY